jgi:hypothetical protein
MLFRRGVAMVILVERCCAKMYTSSYNAHT